MDPNLNPSANRMTPSKHPFSNKAPCTLLFLFFWALYSLIILTSAQETLRGNEDLLHFYASNLTEGTFSPADPYQLSLWNGPGYPLTIAPFTAWQIPISLQRYMNAIWLALAVLFIYGSLRLYLNHTSSLVWSSLIGAYPPWFTRLPLLVSESLTICLISGFLFFSLRTLKAEKTCSLHLGITTFFLTGLCLTRVLFGYAVLCSLPLTALLLKTHKKQALQSALILILCLAGCSPWLIYTHKLTDRTFYWSNAGGSSLYWMSSPYPGELGDWHGKEPEPEKTWLHPDHGTFFASIKHLTEVEKDDALKKMALENIKNHPLKFMQNWLANCGRLLFSYPYSHTPLKITSMVYLAPTTMGLLLLGWGLNRRRKNKLHEPLEIKCLLVFSAIYFSGSTLLSAYPRFFMVLVPILGVWIAYLWSYEEGIRD